MVGSRLRKIFRDVWARKSRALMASTAIFVGVLGVVTLLSAGDLLTSQLRQDIRQEDLPMQAVFEAFTGTLTMGGAVIGFISLVAAGVGIMP